MKRIWKVWIFFLLLGIGAAVLGTEYLNRVILPVKLRGWIETTASQTLHRKVTVGRIRAGLFSGIVLEQITVEEDARYGKQPFLQIDRISGKVLYLPLLKQQRFLIPVIRIVRPRGEILQDSNGLWNIQSLTLAQPKKAGQAPSRFQILVPRILIEEGQLQIGFHAPGHRVKLNLQKLDAQLGLALPSKISGVLTTQLGNGSTLPIALKLEGELSLPQKQFTLQAHSLVPLQSLITYLPPQTPLPIENLQGSSSLEMALEGKLQGPFTLSGSLQTEGLHWKLQSSPKPEWLAQGLEGQGDLRVTVKAQAARFSASHLLGDGEALVELNRITLRPVPILGELRDLTGKIRIRSEGIAADGLTAALASGELLTLNGSLANDGKRTFALRASASLPLNQLPSVPSEIQKFAQEAKLTGQVALEATGEGHLKPTLSIRPAVAATFHHGALDLPQIGNVREVEGTVHWQPDLLTVTNLKGQLRDLPFEIEGTLVNFSRPEIDARASWGPLAAETRLTIDGNRAEIHTLSGHYGKTDFHIFGEVNGWKEPIGNLYGETRLDLTELPGLLPNPPGWLKSTSLKGSVETRWIQKGPLAKPAEWEFGLKAASSSLSYAGIPLEKGALDLDYQEGLITLHSADVKLAGGNVSAAGSLRAQDPGTPWSGQLNAQDLDLASLAQILNWKTQNLSGRLFLGAQAGGKGADLSTLQGNGTIQVRGGRILELPALGQFAELLNLPTLRTIAFQEAQGPFVLESGAIRTETFQLRAPQATLTMIGWGGFLKGADSPIDWRIVPTLSPELIPQESRLKLGRAIAKGASYFVGEIRVTGTWKNPKSTFVSKPITQILNEQIFNLQDVLKDLF
ncbi:MAG: hypothetical protein HY211_08275 [Candidatus Omnitrophica bacterium]|nr:hypothetical protein [Candidatus Omnitrophota bacterium]